MYRDPMFFFFKNVSECVGACKPGKTNIKLLTVLLILSGSMIVVCLFFFFFFCLFRAAPTAFGGSQVRGHIGAVAAGLHQSHSNPDPSHVCNLHHSSQQGRILNPLREARDPTCVIRDTTRFVSTAPRWELCLLSFLYFFFNRYVLIF